MDDVARPGLDLRPDIFSAVDASTPENQHASVVGLDLVGQMPAVRRLRAWALERLYPQPGMVAVGVGCGAGEDAQGVAVTVAPDGRVIGVDVSTAMISEARRRAEAVGNPAHFETAPQTLFPLATHRSTCCDARESATCVGA